MCGKPTTNYKSIHFIINGKEMNDEEIQTISLSDSNNEFIYLYKNIKEFFNMYYHIKVILNHPINLAYNYPQLFLTRVVNNYEELKYL